MAGRNGPAMPALRILGLGGCVQVGPRRSEQKANEVQGCRGAVEVCGDGRGAIRWHGSASEPRSAHRAPTRVVVLIRSFHETEVCQIWKNETAKACRGRHRRSGTGPRAAEGAVSRVGACDGDAAAPGREWSAAGPLADSRLLAFALVRFGLTRVSTVVVRSTLSECLQTARLTIYNSHLHTLTQGTRLTRNA